MPNEDGAEVPQSPIPETPSSPPVEAAPVIPQSAAPEHSNLFQKLVARIQSTFGGRKDASASVNMQPPAPTAETPQPQSTPGTPTT